MASAQPIKPTVQTRRWWTVWTEKFSHPRNPTKLMEWRMKPNGEWYETCFCRFVPFKHELYESHE